MHQSRYYEPGMVNHIISRGHRLVFPNQDQRHSQNAEKVMHIKGRLLDQAMILFNYVPIQMGTSVKGKSFSFITLSDLPLMLLFLLRIA